MERISLIDILLIITTIRTEITTTIDRILIKIRTYRIIIRVSDRIIIRVLDRIIIRVLVSLGIMQKVINK